MRQLAFLDDRFIFLTVDGQVGSFDEHFNFMNLNLALRDVGYLLSSEWALSRNTQAHFVGPIEFSPTQGALSWNLETDLLQQKKQILFKVYFDTIKNFIKIK